MAGTANELAAHDNPFALLCIGRTSVEAAYGMTNDDYQKAYRRVSLQLHPDKCQGDAEQQTLTTELFRKSHCCKGTSNE